ncbi:MAG TPA: hypothetical protein VGO97_01490, partial [Solirubrobacterales bacterium]|nr:hypothetical protein [Solirubrobacterales bacterium]
MSQGRGQLAIVLHTHMPYVESFGTWPFGEEWLWRATAESYLRLEDTLARHPLTVGLTPVLADQFEAVKSAAGDRMLDFFRDSREHVFAEDMRSFHEVGEGEMSIALAPQLEDYRRAAARFEELDRDMSRVFAGAAELLAGPATHPIMPLVATDFGRDLQLQTGIDSHRSRFGDWNGGLWLSECAYAPGVERSLERAGVSHFCVDQSRVYGKDSLDNLEPVAAGETVAVPIDWKTVELIWTAQGYPVAAPYRSTFDLTIHSLMPRRNGGGPHDPAEARAQAASDAGDFLRRVRVRLDEYAAQRGRPGTCVVAID